MRWDPREGFLVRVASLLTDRMIWGYVGMSLLWTAGISAWQTLQAPDLLAGCLLWTLGLLGLYFLVPAGLIVGSLLWSHGVGATGPEETSPGMAALVGAGWVVFPIAVLAYEGGALICGLALLPPTLLAIVIFWPGWLHHLFPRWARWLGERDSGDVFRYEFLQHQHGQAFLEGVEELAETHPGAAGQLLEQARPEQLANGSPGQMQSLMSHPHSAVRQGALRASRLVGEGPT